LRGVGAGLHAACPRRPQDFAGEASMKKIGEWMFVGLLVALAATGGWLKERQGSSIADANIEANLG